MAEQKISKELQAGGELLAAEVTYLTAFGWTPLVEPRDAALSTVRWVRSGTTGQYYSHVQALRLQKYLDPAFKEE